MRLKSFHAKSMSEAMRQVRDELGDEAIIVNTREEKGGWVKITAAVEQEAPPPAPPVSAKKEEPKLDPDAIVEMITDTMLRHRVPRDVSEKIIAVAMTQASTDPAKTLATALDKTFNFEEQSQKKKNKPLILVGPPGAGKTLMTAKLAARGVLDGQKVSVITTDIARAGGIEQLTAFLNILSLPLLQAEDAKELKTALGKAQGSHQIIVDTGGLNPFDPQEMKFLAKLMNVEDMNAALVLPAGIDAEESAEIALTFGVLGVKKLIPTRLDFSRHFGGILSAADRAGFSFCESSHTPQVANGILTLTSSSFAGLFLPSSPKKKKS